MTAFTTWRDWAEEHWGTVVVALSISSALTTAVALVVLFNVITSH